MCTECVCIATIMQTPYKTVNQLMQHGTLTYPLDDVALREMSLKIFSLTGPILSL